MGEEEDEDEEIEREREKRGGKGREIGRYGSEKAARGGIAKHGPLYSYSPGRNGAYVARASIFFVCMLCYVFVSVPPSFAPAVGFSYRFSLLVNLARWCLCGATCG